MKKQPSGTVNAWRAPIRLSLWFVCLAAALCVGSATDLTIHLPSGTPISRETVTYVCDSAGKKIGVPGGAFPVEYINGGGNGLAVLPIAGNSLIFSNVSSGSGARYTAQQYTWWEAKGEATLYSDSLTGKIQSSCHRVTRR